MEQACFKGCDIQDHLTFGALWKSSRRSHSGLEKAAVDTTSKTIGKIIGGFHKIRRKMMSRPNFLFESLTAQHINFGQFNVVLQSFPAAGATRIHMHMCTCILNAYR